MRLREDTVYFWLEIFKIVIFHYLEPERMNK